VWQLDIHRSTQSFGANTIEQVGQNEQNSGFRIAVYGSPRAAHGMLGILALAPQDTNSVLAMAAGGLDIFIENRASFLLARTAIASPEQIEIFVVYLTHGTPPLWVTFSHESTIPFR